LSRKQPQLPIISWLGMFFGVVKHGHFGNLDVGRRCMKDFNLSRSEKDTLQLFCVLEYICDVRNNALLKSLLTHIVALSYTLGCNNVPHSTEFRESVT
jgi:uncharacterized membrane protein